MALKFFLAPIWIAKSHDVEFISMLPVQLFFYSNTPKEFRPIAQGCRAPRLPWVTGHQSPRTLKGFRPPRRQLQSATSCDSSSISCFRRKIEFQFRYCPHDQGTHHQKKDFKTEFRAFLKRHELEYDERYVWDGRFDGTLSGYAEFVSGDPG